MRKAGFWLVMAVLLSGCATMTVSNLTANNSLNLVHLSRGMSRSETLAIMGSRVSVYNCDQAALKNPLKVTISNPYRTEMIEAPGRTLEVIYYAIGVSNNNCAIEEDNLMPLVFADAKLIGWGKNYLLEITPVGQKPEVNQQAGQSAPGQADQTVQGSAPKASQAK